ncbi:MAG: hypothetical protein JNM09_06570 [Blastocatellia bacterium]|nr:hypothetical protein [Blastocatellia bacterium]
MWQDILKTAIVGTERNALTIPTRNDALGDVLSKLGANARESSLLSAAAAVALYERAGQLPAKDSQALPVPAEADDVPYCNERAAQHLSLMLSGEYQEVLPEWLAKLTQAQQLVPTETLPQLLDVGLRTTELRESIIRVIGKRGLWLARQKPEWKYAIGQIDEATWETDSHAARLALIKKLRMQDPAAATQRLRSSWQENSPKERTEFLEVLRTNLSPTDEEFLEFALDDRSTIVRQAAAGLLRHLPESGFVKRMVERVRPLVSFSRKPRNKFAVEVTLPAERTAEMLRDGITAKSPYTAVGDKAWWLTLMINAIPFTFWLEFSGLTREQLIQAVRKSEWEKMFLEAWLKSGFRSGDIELIEAILQHSSLDITWTVLARGMSAPRLDELLIALLKNHQRTNFMEIGGQLLIARQSEWSQELSMVILANWEPIYAHLLKRLSYYVSNLALYVNAALIPQAMAKIARHNPTDKTTENLTNILQFRADMLKEITQ